MVRPEKPSPMWLVVNRYDVEKSLMSTTLLACRYLDFCCECTGSLTSRAFSLRPSPLAPVSCCAVPLLGPRLWAWAGLVVGGGCLDVRGRWCGRFGMLHAHPYSRVEAKQSGGPVVTPRAVRVLLWSGPPLSPRRWRRIWARAGGGASSRSRLTHLARSSACE
jgi:hypothetical protein